MPGVALEPDPLGIGGGRHQALELSRARRLIGMTVSAGVQFDDGSTHGLRGFDLEPCRLDEQGHTNACCRELSDEGPEKFLLSRHVEATLGRALLPALRYEADRVRTMGQRNRPHLRSGRHLEIQGHGDLAPKPANIVIRDVAPILAQMGRNPIGPGFSRLPRRPDRIGMTTAAGIPNRRDVVDIDAEPKPRRGHLRPRLPGLTAGVRAKSAGNASAA